MKYLIIYLIIINAITFIMYFIDKFMAKKHSYRIPEKILFLMALLGGAVGGILGMCINRHKTRKIMFYIWNILCMVGWMYLLVKWG